MYTVVKASQEQAERLYIKHLKPQESTDKVISMSYVSPSIISGNGWVTLYTSTKKKVHYTLYDNHVGRVEFTGFGNIRYDIDYPEQLHPELHKFLFEIGVKAKEAFWKGAEI